MKSLAVRHRAAIIRNIFVAQRNIRNWYNPARNGQFSFI
jgi:hypothetical protein